VCGWVWVCVWMCVLTRCRACVAVCAAQYDESFINDSAFKAFASLFGGKK
jgi:hypothetical protein